MARNGAGLHVESPFRIGALHPTRPNATTVTTMTPTTSRHTSRTRTTRIGQRRQVRVPGRLTWRDASGTLRFASVVTADVSDVDAFVEMVKPSDTNYSHCVTPHHVIPGSSMRIKHT